MVNQSIDGPSHKSMGRYERLPNKAVAMIDGDDLSCLESNKCSKYSRLVGIQQGWVYNLIYRPLNDSGFS